MLLDPKSKMIAYPIEKLEWVELALNDIEKEALTNDGVSGNAARSIVTNLNSIRSSLCLREGVKRHNKFITDQQGHDDE